MVEIDVVCGVAVGLIFATLIVMFWLCRKRIVEGTQIETVTPRRRTLRKKKQSVKRDKLDKIAPVTVLEEEAEVCAVCLDTLEAGMEARILPCEHTFHVECIEAWTARSIYCPTCRLGLVPEERLSKAFSMDDIESQTTRAVRESLQERTGSNTTVPRTPSVVFIV
eukprot:CAMPEP_0198734272 /NCGR_PEP_ID=MMETSP1475-20131203/51506_1 /TAXON_ID= ORGANISM="Unidentified sp., Strain CCMP1999" /NCGR_SAMPLE_ID=MMETSP1475 /ASSEMBLY_ACC=CAM_ASM_001111 /LENGTH=165 /DNA_ID=CAMNT_0044497709 /DNA_START=52 /DNA_END=549 /DNA_ORIENTATION=+